MIALAIALLTPPLEMRLPAGGMCPSAAVAGDAVSVVYGDGKDGWFLGDRPARINSTSGTVHAGGERGPKIAIAGQEICVAWQGDYRQDSHVWFSRSADGGKTFEAQRDLLDGKTPGLDEVTIASWGDTVAVFWLDGRGGQDKEAPVTSTIWYCLSEDGGKTFGENRMIASDRKLRACGCCTFDPSFLAAGRVRIYYRSGIDNVRDIWTADGSPRNNKWEVRQVTHTGWKLNGCPMDGPRGSSYGFAYSADGNCYVGDKPLGNGRYAAVAPWGLAAWQSGEWLYWKDLVHGGTGSYHSGPGRAALVAQADGRTLIIH